MNVNFFKHKFLGPGKGSDLVPWITLENVREGFNFGLLTTFMYM